MVPPRALTPPPARSPAPPLAQSNTTSTDSIAPGGYSKSQNCRTVRSTLSQRTGCSLSLLISVDSAATQRETTPIARRAVAPCAAAYRLFLPYQYYEAFSRPVTGTDGCVLRRPGSGYVSYVRSGTTVYERVRSCQSGIGIGESRLRRKAAGRRAGTRSHPDFRVRLSLTYRTEAYSLCQLRLPDRLDASHPVVSP